jgi:drug/metabolite transporter (DMT)-like permease
VALVGFAANSLLTRFALETGAIDPSTFMVVRLVSGALTLAAIAGWRAGAAAGSWRSALALAVYALAFTFAYLRIGASIGALLLFGSVQGTMVGWAVVRGERPTARGWLGLALALVGLVVLTAPGLTAPDTTGAMLMIVAGAAWGSYSLRGRRVESPLLATAGNFLRAVPLAFMVVALSRHDMLVTGRGLLLAFISGSVASGLAYAAWYVALAHLTAWRAAILQLSVPVITAGGAAVLLGEGLTLRLAVAGAAIVGGVVLSIPSDTQPRVR